MSSTSFPKLVFFWFFALGAAASAQYTAEFLRIPVGARAQGMGGAFVAVANDATAPFWNPAGLANREARWQLGASYVQMFGNLAQHQFVGASCKISLRTAIGLSWVHLGIGDIPRYAALQGTRFDRMLNPALRSDGKPKGFFVDSEDALFLTFSRAVDFDLAFGDALMPSRIPMRFALGFNMKLIRQRLDDFRGLGQGLDIGAIFELLSLTDEGIVRRRLALGINVVDLASAAISWNTPSKQRNRFPLVVARGLAYQETLPWLGGRLTVSLKHQTDRQDKLAWGGEYEIHGVFFLRGGIDGENWSAGAGMRFNWLLLDYAFVTHDLGNSNRLSASAEF